MGSVLAENANQIINYLDASRTRLQRVELDYSAQIPCNTHKVILDGRATAPKGCAHRCSAAAGENPAIPVSLEYGAVATGIAQQKEKGTRTKQGNAFTILLAVVELFSMMVAPISRTVA